MSHSEPQISILDARLAEIDRRLQIIQTGLGDEPSAGPPAPSEHPGLSEQPGPAGPAPADPPALPPRVEVPEARLQRVPLAPPTPPAAAAPSPGPPGPEAAALVSELRELAVAHRELLEAMRGLVSDGERALARVPRPPSLPTAAAPATALADSPLLTVTAGPFTSTQAVRGFEQALAGLPGVTEVEIRGYEGGNRAVVDVHLSGATS